MFNIDGLCYVPVEKSNKNIPKILVKKTFDYFLQVWIKYSGAITINWNFAFLLNRL